MTKLEIGKSYRLYGKMGDMRRMRPVKESAFVSNLIHAEVFIIRNKSDKARMLSELDYLNTQGKFEYREVK